MDATNVVSTLTVSCSEAFDAFNVAIISAIAAVACLSMRSPELGWSGSDFD
ncbi:hypothetical protein WMO32_05735 [Xanthomonas oryzae pv. oryzicola]|uniref:hypothetical protein n=1 Tax=Xanthomonas oryzae TaxID=347 RepID=UPI003132A08F